jgi:uncharacterized Zn finger protein
MIEQERFKCAKCGASTFDTVEKDRGDFIVRCMECTATNVLKVGVVNKVAVLMAEIIGWKD